MDPGAGNYRWSTGDSTNMLSVTTSGAYWVSRTNACGSTSVDSFYISFVDSLPAPHFPDSVLCAGALLTYTVDPDQYTDAVWNGSINSLSFNISAPGNYYVEVSSTCGNFRDSFDIALRPVPTLTPIADTIICVGAPLYLSIRKHRIFHSAMEWFSQRRIF
jgi:hypothetical protein